MGFPIETFLAIFDVQVTPMRPTKYRVSEPRDVGGVGFLTKLLTPLDRRRTTDNARRTTDIDRSQ